MALATTLLSLVPGLIRLVKGDKAGDVVDKAANVAKTLTGENDPERASQKLQSDPELLLKYREAMNPIVVAELGAETARLEATNRTMRAEYEQEDKYTKRWRPTYGYFVAVSWAIQMIGLTGIIGYSVVKSLADAPEVIAAITGSMSPLMALWAIALSVLGVNIRSRSDDKARKMGHTPEPGVLGKVAAIFKRN